MNMPHLHPGRTAGRRLQSCSPFRVNGGYSLIEILVAVLVLAIGLLGLAQLQLTSIQNTHSSHLRSVATALAYDMADRVRANQAGFQTGAYNNPAAAQDASCLGAGCAPAAMAGHDAFEWQADAAAQLPSGAAVICLDSTPNDGTSAAPACDGGGQIYAIKVWWADDKTGNLQQFVTNFEP